MRRLSWSQRARRDLEIVESYWLPDRPDFVAEVHSASRESMAFLLETPGAGSPVGSAGLRRWRIGATPYLILYRFTRQELRILRIHHEHQDWRPIE